MKRVRIVLIVASTALVVGSCSDEPRTSGVSTPAVPALVTTTAPTPDLVASAQEDFQEALDNVRDVALTVPGDGMFTIVPTGRDGEMFVGEWESAGGPSCLWTLTSPAGDLVDGGSASTGDFTVTIRQADVGGLFGTTDCAVWRRVG